MMETNFEAVIPSDVGTADLIAALTNDNSQLVALAATGLGDRGRASRLAVPHLVEVLLEEECNNSSIEIRSVVETALRQIERSIREPINLNQLFEDLQGKDSVQTARALVLLGDPQSIEHASEVLPRLQARLSDLGTPLRRLAIDTLGEFGPRAAEILIERIQHDDGLRWAAAENLNRITPIETPLLDAAYDGADDIGRIILLSLFGRSNTFNADAVFSLVKRGLSDDDAGVRLEATSSVEHYAEELAPLVDDFASALQRECDERRLGLRTMREGIDDENYYVDDFAEALGLFGQAAMSAIPRLMPLLDDHSAAVRDAAFCAILRIGGGSSELPRLLEFYRSAESDEWPRWTALLAPHLNSEQANEMVLGWLLDSDPHSIEAAAQLLAEAGDGGPDAVHGLVGAVSHADKPAYLAILRAIGRLGETTDSLPVLLAAVREDDDDIRNKAVTAILRLHRRPTEAVTALVEMRDSLGVRGRLAVDVALYKLSQTHDHRIVEQLLDLMESCDELSEVKSDCEQWLIAIGRPAAESIWERLLGGRLAIDDALDLLEHSEFDLTPDDIAPIALKSLQSKNTRLCLVGADVARRFPLRGHEPAIAALLWKLAGNEEDAVRCYAGDALVRMAASMPGSGFRRNGLRFSYPDMPR